MKLKCQSHLFNLKPDSIYLNGAYMSPLLKSAEMAGIEGMLKKRSPSQFKVNDFFDKNEEVKSLFAKLINVTEANRICTISSVSYGLANVAKNISIKQRESICLLGEQFPSNYYIWKRLADDNGAFLKIIDPPKSLKNRGRDWNIKLLDSLTNDVKIVAMSHIHWADGTKFDLKSIRKRCDEIGAYLIIDGTQSIGAFPFDQNIIRADAIVVASYKWLFGPYSIGVAFYGPRFDDGRPIEESWINRMHSEDFTNLVRYQDEFRPGAQRYAVGENSNFILVPMMLEGLKQLLQWDPPRFQEYCKGLVDDLNDEIVSKGYWIEDESYRANHLFGIKIPEHISAALVKEALQRENISVSFRGSFIRVSPSVYNSVSEMKKFAYCLSKMT